MEGDDELLKAEIAKHYPSAKEIKPQLIVDSFLGGRVYYAEFVVDGNPDGDFCYAFVEKQKARIYDDGVRVVEGLQLELDRRRSVLQRLSEFTLVEVVGAMIAVAVTGTFIYKSTASGKIDEQFVGLFGIILGYYFGKGASNGK